MKEFKGRLIAKKMRIGIVVARFNEFITRSLLSGAMEAIEKYGIEKDHVSISWVPGSFEIPLIAKRMAKSGQVDSVICLGAVIKGETTHFEHVCNQVASGISHVALQYEIPVIFGVLTTDTIEQAIERSGSKAGNKGFEAVQTAIEMVDLMRQTLSQDVKK